MAGDIGMAGEIGGDLAVRADGLRLADWMEAQEGEFLDFVVHLGLGGCEYRTRGRVLYLAPLALELLRATLAAMGLEPGEYEVGIHELN